MSALLAGVPFRLRSLGEFPGVIMPPEDGETYADNAVAKARAVAAATRRLALADDSGLEVDALDGRPGVRSARYGGAGLADGDRVRLLLEALCGVPPERRTARFRSAIAICDPAGGAEVVEGAVEGRLLDKPRGDGGFGYDPIFYHPPSRATFSELSPALKNAVSHRAQALVKARRLLLDRSLGTGSRA
jgi:XTP/dITP diphosphohydrolase